MFAGGNLGYDKVVEAANTDRDTLDFEGLQPPLRGEALVPNPGITVSLDSTGHQAVHVADGKTNLAIKLSSDSGIEDVRGTGRGDMIYGNARANTVWGLGGDDHLFGGAGADTISGGAGNDVISGADQADLLNGDGDDDTISGGAGGDTISGGPGDDKLTGDGGDDVISGDADDDTLEGSDGADTLWGGGGIDSLKGEDDPDKLHGGGEADTLEGGGGTDQLFGDEGDDKLLGGPDTDNLDGGTGDDTLDGGTGADAMDGGDDFDVLKANRGDETLSNGERVEIAVDTGQPQNDLWSCGPNSGSRLLRAYGLNVSYAQLKQDAQNETIISQYDLGTPPPALKSIMQKYRPSTQLASGASIQTLLGLLGQGRPVVALIGWDPITVPFPLPTNPFNTETAPTKLHYILLTGFDQSTGALFAVDTDGSKATYSAQQFTNLWNWPATGPLYDALAGLGVKKQTMIW